MALIYHNNIILRLTQASQHPLSQAMVIRAVRTMRFRPARQWLEDIALIYHVPLHDFVPLGIFVVVERLRVIVDETASAGDYVAISTKSEAPQIVSARKTVGA